MLGVLGSENVIKFRNETKFDKEVSIIYITAVTRGMFLQDIVQI